MPANPVFTLLSDRATSAPSTPVVTYWYADGARTELSSVTLLNAVSKAANLLRDDYDVEPGSQVSLTIPWHWQRVPWLLAVLTLGAQPLLESGAAVEIGSVHTLIDSTARDRLAVSLHPFGLPTPDLPVGIVDAAIEMRLHPDTFLAEPVDAELTADAITAARKVATHFAPGSRVLIAGPPQDSWFLPALLPLVAPISVVLTECAADADAIAAQEATTATL